MGGDWIPSSFAPAPQDVWERLSKVIRLDEWYRHVAVTRMNATQLRLREGNETSVLPVSDGILEVFECLRSRGEDSAIIFDRMFRRCWFTNEATVEPFLEYSMDIDDQYCEIK